MMKQFLLKHSSLYKNIETGYNLLYRKQYILKQIESENVNKMYKEYANIVE